MSGHFYPSLKFIYHCTNIGINVKQCVGSCRFFSSGWPWAWLRWSSPKPFILGRSDHRRHPDLWGPDQSTHAPPFSGDRRRDRRGGVSPVLKETSLRLHECGRGERGIFLPSKYAFRARFTHFSLSLTLPSGRKYITRLVKLRDSSVGVGISGVTEKGNTYPSSPIRGRRKGTWNKM